MKLHKKLILFFICIIFSTSVFAQANPMTMMRNLSDRMLASLRQNRARLKRNPKYIYTLVKRIIVPHADLPGMSRSVLGRTAWKSANAQQRQAFISAFTNIMISTYASALNAYEDEKIEFFPLRGGYQGKRRVRIQSQVIRSDGPPIPLNYKLALIKNTWKIYDLNVEGVSLLQSFYSQFQAKLSQGKTVTQITRELRRRKK
ncbi:MAG: ABC transporter substrate-binding protein [Gammaproteobacteria bacterium]